MRNKKWNLKKIGHVALLITILVLIHAVILLLIPYIKEIHGF